MNAVKPQVEGESDPSKFHLTDLRIRNKSGQLVSLIPNPAQEQYERTAGKRNIVLKARQLGITTWVAAKFFLDTINHDGTLTVQVAHDQRAAEAIFRIVHRFLEHLREARPDHEELKTSRSNVRQIIFKKRDSEYRVETAADFNAGRGSTIRNLHCSEVAMWPGDPAATLAGLRAAVPPDGTIVLESTPRGAAGAFYDEWQRTPETGYVRHFFPWWMEPDYRRDIEAVDFTDEERELMRLYDLKPDQIAFRREVKANFGQRAREEYAEDAETCFRVSGDCVFEIETIDEQLRKLAPPCTKESNGILEIYFPPATGKKYIIGADPAGGSEDGDYACAEVIDRESGQQCAELLGHIRPVEFAKQMASLAAKFNRATVVVERNNHGHAVLVALQPLLADGTLWHETKDAPGWLTTVANRAPTIERLGALLRTKPTLFSSRRLLEQCRRFVRGRDGRPEAAPGAHDDAVMAIALAHAVRERN